MADIVSNVVGLVEVAINLGKALQKAITSYRQAHEIAEDIEIFGMNLNADRLGHINVILQHQNGLDSKAVANLERALRDLNQKLQDGESYFLQHQPGGRGQKLWWALRAEKKIKRLNRDLQERLDDITGLLQLAYTSSLQMNQQMHPLTEPNFSFIPPTTLKPLDGLQSSPTAWALSHYRPSDAAHIVDYKPEIHVLVERTPSDDQVARGHLRGAQQMVKYLRGIVTTNSNTRYHTGLLPCIGYTEHKRRTYLVFLLPRNTILEEHPRSLQSVIVDSKNKDSNPGMTLETRFDIALQLARALHTIHAAGFSNCSIRSDKILFIQGRVSPAQTDVVSKDSPTEPIETGAPRPGIWRRLTGPILQPSNHRSRKSTRNEEKEKQEDKRQKSPSSVRRSQTNNAQERSASPPERAQARFPETSVLEIGDIPPGGSVFLADWRNMREHIAGRTEVDRNWRKDLYRHPSQQGIITKPVCTGHEVYALGVCLLEIGLWEAMIWKDTKGYRVSETLARELNTRSSRGARQLKSLLGGTEGREGPERVRKMLSSIATRELPKLMGVGYARVVQACLECMDNDCGKYWDVDFRDQRWGYGQLEDQKRLCNAVEDVIISGLTLSQNLSALEELE